MMSFADVGLARSLLDLRCGVKLPKADADLQSGKDESPKVEMSDAARR